MSKLFKSPWFWVVAIAVISIGGYFAYNHFVNGASDASDGGASEVPNKVDIVPGAASGNAISATNGTQSPVNLTA